MRAHRRSFPSRNHPTAHQLTNPPASPNHRPRLAHSRSGLGYDIEYDLEVESFLPASVESFIITVHPISYDLYENSPDTEVSAARVGESDDAMQVGSLPL